MKPVLFCCLFSLFCSSCSLLDPTMQDRAPAAVTLQGKIKPQELAEAPTGLFSEEERQAQVQQLLQELDEGNRLFNQKIRQALMAGEPRQIPEQSSSATWSGDLLEVSFNFYDADLVEVVRLFMHLLGDNYTLHPGVGGRVSLSVEDAFNRDQLLELLEGVLRIHGAGLIRTGAFWEILPQSEIPSHVGADRLVLFDDGLSPIRGQIIRGFRLFFISAEEMTNIIAPYLSKGAQVYAEERRGVLLVSDFPHILNKVASLVEVFDESVFADIKANVYALRHVNAVDAVQELEEAAKAFGLNAEKGGTHARVSFLPLERTNTLIVLARDGQVLELMDAWIAELDKEIPQVLRQEYGDNIFVYYVQFGRAEDIVKSLAGLFDNASGGTSDREAETRNPKKNPSSSGSGLFGNDGSVQTDEGRSGADNRGEGIRSSTGQMSGEVTFVVDEPNNAILIRCNSSDYARVLSVIEKLDQYPKQVLIEVVIAEVGLNDSTRLGVEWSYLLDMQRDFTFGSIALDSRLGVIGAAADPLLIGSGLTYLVQSTNRLQAAIKALASVGSVQILSTPTLLASDNQEAMINIGEEVPIPTSTRKKTDETTTAETLETTIQYRDTGIILKVTPQINKQGMVRMVISQEVSELINKPVQGVDAPSISTRNAQTTLSVNDQQTIVIGGLIKQTQADSFSGIPGLNRIPILKYLFGYKEKSFANTELMIFITPHVILSEPDSRFITRDFLTRLEDIKASMR